MLNFLKPKPISIGQIYHDLFRLKSGEYVTYEPEQWQHLILKENVPSKRS